MSRPKPPVQPSAADRLSRLLAMVPWLLAHQGAPLEEVAARFAITTAQLVKDLELLFVCGTPGHLPDDLIEADWEGGRVHLRNADAISRPLRLGIDEALALITGLRTLLDVPGFAGAPADAGEGDGAGGSGGSDGSDGDALTTALAKLTEAAGEAALASRALAVDLSRDTRDGAQVVPSGQEAAAAVLTTARAALRGTRRLRLHYLVPSRDETTERDVDPMRLLTVDGHWYLEGWCHRADAVRLFRLDRVVSAALLDDDGTPPPQAVARDVDDGLFTPGADDLVVTLELAPAARWLADHVPVESVTELDGPADEREGELAGEPGRLRVVLRTADDRWLRRLLLPLGGAAVVVDPPEVAEGVRAAAAAALAAHGGPGGVPSQGDTRPEQPAP